MTNLTWKTSILASAVHAAWSIVDESSSGLLLAATDDSDREAFFESATLLEKAFGNQLELPLEGRWRYALSFACSQNERNLNSPDSLLVLTPRILGILAELEANFRLLYPKIDEQLALRGRPLQEQWLGYGRGLMAHVKRLTDPDWLVTTGRVTLVQPIVGGAGLVFPEQQQIMVEAILTNPNPMLPEVLRVAWLASQLGTTSVTGLSANNQSISTEVVGIAMMVCTLAAGEVLDLCQCNEKTIETAMGVWHIATPVESSMSRERPLPAYARTRGKRLSTKAVASLPKVLLRWWETYLQTRPPLSIALQALERMLTIEADD